MSEPSPPQPGNQRRVSNFFLQPLLQVRLGLYNIVLSTAFGAAVFGLLYAHHQRQESLLETISGPQQAALRTSLADLGVWFALVVLIFVTATVLSSVVFTHRLVGPSYAFRRHLAELLAGNYGARITLRKHDAFVEVADDLNQLAAALEARHKPAKSGE